MAGRDEINAFLGSGTVYTGELSFEGAVRIDGVFSGNIASEGTLIVGHGAKVEGSIKVGSLVSSGFIKGEIVVSEKVVLHKTAQVQGKISTGLLVMEEGAQLDGNLAMKKTLETVSSAERSSEASGEIWPAPDRDSVQ